MERFLEVGAHNAMRMGFYTAPADLLEIEILEWHVKEGDTLTGIPDTNTGTMTGPVVVTVSVPGGKDTVDIEAQDDEIGARVKEILLPVGAQVTVDLRAGSLDTVRFAILEIAGTSPASKESIDQQTEEPRGEGKHKLRASPKARSIAQAHGVSLEAIRDDLPVTVRVIEAHHVEEFLARQQSRGTATENVKASPHVRKTAQCQGIDLTAIRGTGPDGIIRLVDLPTNDQAVSPVVAQEVVDREHYLGVPVAKYPWSARRAGIANAMVVSQTIPRANGGIDICSDALRDYIDVRKADFLKDHGVPLRRFYLYAVACARLLADPVYRILNSAWDDKAGVPRLYDEVNIGLTIAMTRDVTKSGISELVIPVVRNADRMTLVEFAKAAHVLVEAALSGKPVPGCEEGRTFVVNNVGAQVTLRDGTRMPGDEFPGPIVPTNVAMILALGADRRVLDPETTSPKTLMRVVPAFDHRLFDGQEPMQFLRELQQLLEDPGRITVLY